MKWNEKELNEKLWNERKPKEMKLNEISRFHFLKENEFSFPERR